MQKIIKLTVVVVIAVATAHWWMPPAVKLAHLLASNFDMIRQTIG